MASVGPPRIPLDEALRGAVGPASLAGCGLCGVAAAGLARLALRAILQLPSELFTYVAMMLLGMALILVEVLSHLWSQGALQWILARMLLWYMRLAQRMVLLSYMPSVKAKDWKVLLFEVLPHYITAGIGSKGLRDALERIRAAKAVAGSGGMTEHASAALEWLKRPQLAIGYEEQVQLYGLARQVSQGDCPTEQAREPSGAIAGGAELDRRRSWEKRRGLPRKEAAHQLVRTLAAVDPGFCNAHPLVASSLPPPPLPEAGHEVFGAEFVRLACGLLEARLPADLDDRLHRGKRWLLVAAVALTVLGGGVRRLRQSPRWRALAAAAGRRAGRLLVASFCAYLFAITYGLPPSVYARMPRALRLLPHTLAQAAEEAVGGPAPRLCRQAAQALLPPVRGSLLRES